MKSSCKSRMSEQGHLATCAVACSLAAPTVPVDPTRVVRSAVVIKPFAVSGDGSCVYTLFCETLWRRRLVVGWLQGVGTVCFALMLFVCCVAQGILKNWTRGLWFCVNKTGCTQSLCEMSGIKVSTEQEDLRKTQRGYLWIVAV